MNINAIAADTSNLDSTQRIKLLRQRCLKREEGIKGWRDIVGDMPCWKRTEDSGNIYAKHKCTFRLWYGVRYPEIFHT